MISMFGKVISLVTFPASAMTAVCVFGSTFAVAEGVSLATQKKVKVPGTTGTQTRLVGSGFFKELSGAHLACVQPLWKFGAAPYRYLGSALLGGTKDFVRPKPNKPYNEPYDGISSIYDAKEYAEDLRKNALLNIKLPDNLSENIATTGVSPHPFPGSAGVSQLYPSADMSAKST